MQEKIQNYGICPKCEEVVPVRHVEQDGRMYLSHECPQCGTTNVLISSNAQRWRFKRELCNYKGEAEKTCSLRCLECNHGKPPSLVFLDVTNYCNMNCPICLANIPAMGFVFNPPMEYFDKVFRHLSTLNPKPKIELFGGEPTVRDDLIDIINLAASYGLQARVVTNGIRLEDEEYAKKLLATGTQLMFAFDGRSPKIYEKLRKNPRAYEQKLRGLENVRKYRRSKITIMCCAGLRVNEEYIGDLIDFCHEGRDYIAALDLIPLVETWGPDTVDAGDTTIEDVERMVRDAVKGVEFVPAGTLCKFQTFLDNFNVGRLTFGGAHPNCESVTAFISDGTRYRPISDYLKRPLTDVVMEALDLDQKYGEKIKRSLICKVFGKTGRRIILLFALLNFIRRNVKLKAVFGDKVLTKSIRILFGMIRGEKTKTLFRKYTQCQNILRVIVLPFEEPRCVESARVVECPASFAYEHPVTGEIRLMPVCTWSIYKNSILRATTEKYGVAKHSVQLQVPEHRV
ncbi:radical SAM protein [Candidatus Sumerlaeota bacterium]|nr:radical SAM protein [Candidatus Sumerlaeota bacterium]